MTDSGSGLRHVTACGRLREQPAAARPRPTTTHTPRAGRHSESSSEPVAARLARPIDHAIGKAAMPPMAGNRASAPGSPTRHAVSSRACPQTRHASDCPQTGGLYELSRLASNQSVLGFQRWPIFAASRTSATASHTRSTSDNSMAGNSGRVTVSRPILSALGKSPSL